jgi:WXG100 family type VII secretion target
MAAERELVRVQPDAMHVASQALSAAAKDLHARLVELDGQVRELLHGWHGGSGGAYSDAWNSWHRGADEVQQGLLILAEAVGVAGMKFDAQEQQSARAVDGIYHG